MSTETANAIKATRPLEIGALCAPISEQLAGLISDEDAHQLDADAKAITRCNLLGYMPDSTTERARKKLLVKAQRAVNRFSAKK